MRREHDDAHAALAERTLDAVLARDDSPRRRLETSRVALRARAFALGFGVHRGGDPLTPLRRPGASRGRARSSSVVVSPFVSPPAATSFRRRRMIFPLRVFGSESAKRIDVGARELADLLVDVRGERVLQLLRRPSGPALSVTKTTSAWPLSSSGRPTAAASATDGVAHEGALDLGGADAVAGDVEHVVDAADDPEVAVLVASRAVAREVDARDDVPVRLEVALVVAPERARHRRPRPPDDELAALVRLARVAAVLHDGDVDAEERQAGAPRLGEDGARKRRQHDRRPSRSATTCRRWGSGRRR